MSGRPKFTSDEWESIKNAPLMAGMYSVQAAPSGPIGIGKEMIAVAKAIAAESEAPNGLSLVKAIGANAGQGQEAGAQAAQPETPETDGDDLTRVVALLDSKVPGESVAFRQWLYDVATKVAATAVEGGFLCIGGTPVSKEEEAALAELATILNVTV